MHSIMQLDQEVDQNSQRHKCLQVWILAISQKQAQVAKGLHRQTQPYKRQLQMLAPKPPQQQLLKKQKCQILSPAVVDTITEHCQMAAFISQVLTESPAMRQKAQEQLSQLRINALTCMESKLEWLKAEMR